ncbi:hypothetical protein THAOC_09610, partial [Thalassiosira oceanica]
MRQSTPRGAKARPRIVKLSRVAAGAEVRECSSYQQEDDEDDVANREMYPCSGPGLDLAGRTAVQSSDRADVKPPDVNCLVTSKADRHLASAERAKKKAELEKIRYFSLDQTQPIAVKDGFVTFTMHFKYLGSFISYNLRDDFDIDLRIKKADMAMGALKHFFNNEHVDTYTKHLIFKAIPLNLLLWGCETWSLREDHYVKLESFLQRSIRNILNINMTQVKDDHI